MKRILPLLMLLGAFTAHAQQEPKSFGEKIDVNTVLVDAIVTDSRGNQILGLTKDDFIVKENGAVQSIDAVDYYTNRRLLNGQEQSADFKAERVREPRYYVLFFDKPSDNQMFDRVAMARRQAQEFVEHELQPNDYVAVAGQDVRLKIYSDFTTDRARLRKALDDAGAFGLGILPKDAMKSEAPSILANVDAKKMMSGSGTAYEALETLADSLRPIRARKNLVLFSPGILANDDQVAGGVVVHQSRHFDPMIDALNAANVTVYPVNIIYNVPATPALHQTLERLASETNGNYFRYANSFSGPLKRIENETNGYYLITYRTKKTGRGFQHVDVALRNPEFRVKAREGYSYGE